MAQCAGDGASFKLQTTNTIITAFLSHVPGTVLDNFLTLCLPNFIEVKLMCVHACVPLCVCVF